MWPLFQGRFRSGYARAGGRRGDHNGRAARQHLEAAHGPDPPLRGAEAAFSMVELMVKLMVKLMVTPGRLFDQIDAQIDGQIDGQIEPNRQSN